MKLNILPIIVGFLLICFIVWNRAIRAYLPKDISIFMTNDFLYFLLWFNCLFSMFLILYNIKLLLKINQSVAVANIIYKLSQNKVIKYFHETLNTYIIKSPKRFYEVIFQTINVAVILEKLFYKISNILRRQSCFYQKVIFTVTNLIFNFLPRFIVALIFINDILKYKELNYFYKSLFLLLIPMSFRALLYILQDLADKNTYYATAHFKFKPSTEKGTVEIVFRNEIPPIEDAIDIITHRKNKKLLEWFGYMYETYRDIKWLVFHIQENQMHLKPYEIILIYSLYLLGWGYILYLISQ